MDKLYFIEKHLFTYKSLSPGDQCINVIHWARAAMYRFSVCVGEKEKEKFESVDSLLQKNH